MNIVEAYIKFKGQLLIFISGLPGCGKLELAKNISEDFKLKIIDQYNYYIQNYSETIKLPDGTEVINWYTDDAIDWDKFNQDIDEMKGDGLIVIGISFPEDKITSKPDYHIHLNISKQACVERRKMFLEKHKDDEKYTEDYNLMGSVVEKLKMNQLIFPYYLESIKKAKINKFLNINEMNNDAVYDAAFDALIDMIKKYLKQENGQSNKLESESDNETDSEINTSDSSTESVSEESDDEKNSEVTTDTVPDESSEASLSRTPKVSNVSKMKKYSPKKGMRKDIKKNKDEKDTTVRIHAQMLARPKYRYELENKKERDRGNMNMMNQFLDPEDFSSDEGPIEFVKI